MATRMQLLGRGTYSEPVVLTSDPASSLYAYKQPPPIQMSVVIYTDGTVEQRASFSTIELRSPLVHTFIEGGHDFQCDQGSFEYNALLAAGLGFDFRPVSTDDIYLDVYDITY